MSKLFQGTFTALVTPFSKGKVDFPSLQNLVRQQVEAGIDGFIVNGTTGESPTLTETEVEEILTSVRALCTSKQKVILGVGTNNTSTTLEWISRANAWEVDGALAVVPYYNKPPQRGLVAHFTQVADHSKVPVILYNVPGRTVQSLQTESVRILSQHKMIAGIKESTGDLGILKEIKAVVPEDFCLLSGDDGTAVDFCLKGGDGVIGVVTHLIPKEMAKAIKSAQAQSPTSVTDFDQWQSLVSAIYTEANPIPVKRALQLMGIIQSAELRLPLVELDEPFTKALEKCLKESKLI